MPCMTRPRKRSPRMTETVRQLESPSCARPFQHINLQDHCTKCQSRTQSLEAATTPALISPTMRGTSSWDPEWEDYPKASSSVGSMRTVSYCSLLFQISLVQPHQLVLQSLASSLAVGIRARKKVSAWVLILERLEDLS